MEIYKEPIKRRVFRPDKPSSWSTSEPKVDVNENRVFFLEDREVFVGEIKEVKDTTLIVDDIFGLREVSKKDAFRIDLILDPAFNLNRLFTVVEPRKIRDTLKEAYEQGIKKLTILYSGFGFYWIFEED